MRSHSKRRDGMTLIEIMITVAIIGILAAIAIPSFANYQNRARRSEAMTNVSAIAKAEISYFGSAGVYHGTDPVPGGGVSAAKRIWNAAAKAAFDPIGYQPEGAVYYDYDVNTLVNCSCPLGRNGEGICFTISAVGDIDGDLQMAAVAYFKRDPEGNECQSASLGLDPPPDPEGDPVYDSPVVMPFLDPFAWADDF